MFLRKAVNSLYIRIAFLFVVVAVMLNCNVAVCSAGNYDSGKIPFYSDDDLVHIRSKIAANGYKFKVSSNWVVKLSRDSRERMRWYRPRRTAGMTRQSNHDNDLGPLSSYLGRPLPANFDLRHVGPGRSYIGPVRRQGSCGACYAFSACAAAEGTYNVATGRYNQNCVDFSEAFITFCLAPLYEGVYGCSGSDYDYEELDALIEKGVCFEEQMPYDPNDHSCPRDFNPPTIRFISWYRLPCNDVTAIKTAIRYFGVVDAAILTNSAFDAYASGIYEDSESSCESPDGQPCYYTPTDHVVALVGWDDNNGDGYWILRNSWGREWGEEGYMRIKYNSARVTCAACYLVYKNRHQGLLPNYKPGAVYPCLQLLLND